MPEAITKYAINSTLGTKDFKPLDKLIKDQRTYVAGDELLVILLNSSISGVSSTETIIPNVNFTSMVDGSISVFAHLYISDHNQGTLYISIYEDDVKISSFSASGKGISTSENVTISNDIIIKKGSKYTFYLQSTNRNGYPILYSLRLCGHVVDLSMLKYND